MHKHVSGTKVVSQACLRRSIVIAFDPSPNLDCSIDSFLSHRFFGLVRGGPREPPGWPRKSPKPRRVALQCPLTNGTEFLRVCEMPVVQKHGLCRPEAGTIRASGPPASHKLSKKTVPVVRYTVSCDTGGPAISAIAAAEVAGGHFCSSFVSDVLSGD
jgi:hypothetical protein